MNLNKNNSFKLWRDLISVSSLFGTLILDIYIYFLIFLKKKLVIYNPAYNILCLSALLNKYMSFSSSTGLKGNQVLTFKLHSVF